MITYICPDVKTISPPHIPSAVVNFGIFWACGRLKWAHLDQRWIIFLAHVRCCLREAKSYKLNVYQIKDSQEQDVSIGIYLNLSIAILPKHRLVGVSAPVFRLVKISSPNMSESMHDQKCELTCCCCGTTDEKGFFFFSATTASGASTGSSSYCETYLHDTKGESWIVVTTWS